MTVCINVFATYVPVYTNVCCMRLLDDIFVCISSSDVNNVVMANKSNRVPAQDQQVALALLLELAVQRGTLSSILGSVLLLLNLWSGNRNDCDNRLSSSLTSAPLIPFLQRFELISTSKKTTTTLKACDVS